ncbi:uncharacterized protein, partial [Polyergus mexicanus]|uniref:uncharacterized protein n=1 Tax=Polyergus mexicanus TaxID=615972 RepID=UPI0038B5F03A
KARLEESPTIISAIIHRSSAVRSLSPTMSLTLTFSGRSSLTNFKTYNTIPNANSTNNKFYFDDNDEVITIPVGYYELSAISAYLRAAIRHKRRQDLYTLPCDSFLYIEDRLESKESSSTQGQVAPVTRLVNNCAAFMFEEIRYELDGVEIDRSRNMGVMSSIKDYASLTVERGKILKNAGWDLSVVTQSSIHDFNFCVPLNVLLGFCEDYKRVMINARHELILIRARNDNNCIISVETQESKVVLLKIQWRMSHIVLNDIRKLRLLRTLDSGRYLSIAFRSWDLYEFPLLQITAQHSWAVKAVTQHEKPRYVIFALQSGKKNVLSEDRNRLFDDCKLNNVKLYLNSDFYPYNMNLDFDKHKVAVLYDMYSKFRKTYYGCDNDEALLN